MNPVNDLPLIARARSHSASIAFRTGTRTHTYQDLLDRSAVLAGTLLGDANDLQETRVVLLVPTVDEKGQELLPAGFVDDVRRRVGSLADDARLSRIDPVFRDHPELARAPGDARVLAVSTSSTTFRVRSGGAAGTATFNGQSSARKYGGTSNAFAVVVL